MKEIPLTQGKVAIVDDEDYERIARYRWSARRGSRTWYAQRNSPRDANGKQHTILLHREVLGAAVDVDVDHRDGDGLNCQRGNLRAADGQSNCRNRRHKVRGTSSRFKGVTWDASRQKWMAQIRLAKGPGGHKNLGRFVGERDAAAAYDRAAIAHFGEFAATNGVFLGAACGG